MIKLSKTKKSISNLFFGSILVFCCFFLQSQIAAAADKVYIEYENNYDNNGVINIYQQLANDDSATYNWVRWRLRQFSVFANGDIWDLADYQLGRLMTLTEEVDRDDFSNEANHSDGTGDNDPPGGWWLFNIWYFDKAISSTNIEAATRYPDTSDGYDEYSASLQYTATQSADHVYLGIYQNPAFTTALRVKVNDVASTTGQHLDANGERSNSVNEVAWADSGAVRWYHVATNIESGDTVKVECKGGASDRCYIVGMRFFNEGGADPTQSNVKFAPYAQIIQSGSEQFVALKGCVDDPLPAEGLRNYFYFGGYAHTGHEYNSSPVLNISVDGTNYTLGSTLNVGDIIEGDSIQASESSTIYATAEGVDDFANLTRTMTWQENSLTQNWQLDFTDYFYLDDPFITMWPAQADSDSPYRYSEIGDSNVFLLTNDEGGIPVPTGGESHHYRPTVDSNAVSYYGGDSGLKVTVTNSDTSSYNYLEANLTDASPFRRQKAYFYDDNYIAIYNNGDILSSTATIDLEYVAPSAIDWSGKTLFVTKDKTFSSANDLLPFSGNSLIVKTIDDGTLTFSGLAPYNNTFTGFEDDTVGKSLTTYTTGSPAAGNWPGIIVSGAVNTYNNILKYATTAIELQSSANSYNNTFDTSTTCINAANGSSAKNNTMDTCSTATTGAGTFDYNLYSGNTETNGVDGTPSFTDSSSGDYSLTSSSAGIDAGLDLGINTDYAGKQRYDLPTTSNTGDIGSNTKDYVDIGAYEYVTPSVPTLTSSSHPSESTWYTDFTPDMSISSSTSSTISYKYLVNQDVSPDASAVQAGTSDDDGIFTVIISSPGTWYVHLIAKNLDSDYSSTFDTYAIKLAASSPLPLISYSTTSSSSSEEKSTEEPVEEITECTLSDIAGHKYEEAIQYICDNKIVNGYDDGTYKPDKTINRAELLKIIIEAVFVDEFETYANTDCFNDVPSNEWYTKYVCFAKEKGIVVGYFGNIFKPAQEISFVEALKIAMVGFAYDFEETTPWYKDIVIQASIFNFIPLDVTQFNQYFTRGQMAELITRILKYESEDLEDYLGDLFDEAVTYEDLI